MQVRTCVLKGAEVVLCPSARFYGKKDTCLLNELKNKIYGMIRPSFNVFLLKTHQKNTNFDHCFKISRFVIPVRGFENHLHIAFANWAGPHKNDDLIGMSCLGILKFSKKYEIYQSNQF